MRQKESHCLVFSKTIKKSGSDGLKYNILSCYCNTEVMDYALWTSEKRWILKSMNYTTERNI